MTRVVSLQERGHMISEETKKIIDSLSKEELLHEVVRGNNSRFQGEKHDYLVARYAILDKKDEDDQKQRELHIAQEANDIAMAANETSSKAYRMSVISVVVAVVALLSVVLQQCVAKP